MSKAGLLRGIRVLIIVLFAFAVLVFGFKYGASDKDNELVILAASSLADSFTELAQAFEADNPGIRVKLHFAGTQKLRTQVEQGVQADIFAAANQRHVQALVEQGLVTQPQVFAHNRLVLVVPEDNPAGIKTLKDLVKQHRLVLALPEVPVGSYSRQVLQKVEEDLGNNYAAKVLENLVSEETSVRNVLTKVALGEADAGFVYGTDLHSDLQDRVLAIPVPRKYNVQAGYYITKLTGSDSTAAQLFIDYVLSRKGQAILSEYGFQ